MKFYEHQYRGILSLAFFLLFVCVLSGCAMVGPTSISMGRGDYNDAINKTQDEQLLMAIVKGRYGDTFSLLSVTGVAANIRFQANAVVQAGFGPNANYLGNLTPFGAGLAYEENPTITYSPIRGEVYFRQLITPISLNILVSALRSITTGAEPFVVLVERINGLRNPSFVDSLTTLSELSDSPFMRFVELFKVLYNAGVIQLAGDPKKEIAFDIVITGYAPRYTEEVSEFLTLLELPVPADEKKGITIPAYFAVKVGRLNGIAISTRSTMDLINIMRASIEMPETHVRSGLTRDYPPLGLLGQGIRIVSSEERPPNTSLAVEYRGFWFYIAENDQKTKAFYRTLRAFWSINVANAVDKSDAPVLTIPVGR